MAISSAVFCFCTAGAGGNGGAFDVVVEGAGGDDVGVAFLGTFAVVFSETFELNRSKIKEGNSVILTIQKIIKQNEPQSTRLNVKKIISLDDLINKPINSISFKVKNVDEVDILSKMLKKGGDVDVNINIVSNDKAYKIKLKDKRFIDRKTVNLIKNQGILTTIH